MKTGITTYISARGESSNWDVHYLWPQYSGKGKFSAKLQKIIKKNECFLSRQGSIFHTSSGVFSKDQFCANGPRNNMWSSFWIPLYYTPRYSTHHYSPFWLFQVSKMVDVLWCWSKWSLQKTTIPSGKICPQSFHYCPGDFEFEKKDIHSMFGHSQVCLPIQSWPYLFAF